MRRLILTAVTLGLAGAAVAGGMHGESGEADGAAGEDGDSPRQDIHWVSPEAATRRVNPIEPSAESVDRGAALFAGNCASCHGQKADGSGPAGVALNPRPPDLRRMSGVHPDGDFAWKIANGRGAMPAWKGTLREDQIWDVTNYIQSLSAGRGLGGDGDDAPGKVLSGDTHGHEGES